MRKLYDWGIVEMVVVDKGKQRGACRQHRFQGIFQAPILAKFRNRSRLEIECKNLRQFFNVEGARSNCNAKEQPPRIFPVCVIDLS